MAYPELLQDKIQYIIELYSSGKVNDALKRVESLIEQYPDDALLHNVSGACYASLDEIDKAISSYNIALTINPNYAEAQNNLGITLHKKGDIDEAVIIYKNALLVKPNYAEAQNNLGNAFKDLGKLDLAIELYVKAIVIKPDFPEAFDNLVFVLKEFDQLEVAIKSYHNVITANPKLSEAHYNLGLVLQMSNEHEEAIKCYEKAIAIKPNYAEAYNNIGIVYKELGQLEDAIKSYEKSLTINPNFAEAHNNLGNVLRELNYLNEAAECFNKVIELQPNIAETHNNLGMIFSQLDKLKKAKSSFMQAIKINPNYADAHCNLGMIYKELGRVDEAISSLKKAIDLEPQYAVGHTNLCTIQYDNHDYVSALKTITDAHAKNPKSKSIRLLFKLLTSKNYSNDMLNNSISVDSYTGSRLTSDPLILNREVEPELIEALYDMKALELDKIRDPSYGNAKGSGYDLFEYNNTVVKSTEEDIIRILMESLKTDIYIEDSFYTILGAGGGLNSHNHITSLDKEPTFNLANHKYSLVYYLDVGDQDCTDPGILKLYDPIENVLPLKGMIIIFPSDRYHSVIYNGKKDRVIIGINFYSL
jgi:tetratricopeptide (TPR) repeat protein